MFKLSGKRKWASVKKDQDYGNLIFKTGFYNQF